MYRPKCMHYKDSYLYMMKHTLILAMPFCKGLMSLFSLCMHACIYVCMHVCVYACMYVCTMHVCKCILCI